jgi:hypothetical protein
MDDGREKDVEKSFMEMMGIRFNANVDEVRQGGELLPSLVVPEVVWRDLPEEERPSSVEADYYESDFQLDEAAMLSRWSGLGQAGAIRRLFEKPYLDRQAERVNRRLEKVGGLDVTNPAYDEWFTNRMALLFDGLLEEEIHQVLEKREAARRNVVTEAGLQNEEYWRVMETKDRALHIRNMEKLLGMSQLVKGKATAINENRNEVKTTMEDLRSHVRAVMSERAGMELASADMEKALPEGVVDGEVLESERERVEF